MKISSENTYIGALTGENPGTFKKPPPVQKADGGGPALSKAEHLQTTELYGADGKVVQKDEQVQQQETRTAVNREMMMKEIWEQSYVLLKEITAQLQTGDKLEAALDAAAEITGDKNDALALGKFFAENPEALEQVKNGEVLEYFNVENTGQRILDIWLPGYDESIDLEEWIEKVKKYVERAYGEVSAIFNGLPDPVMQTKEYVLMKLDEFGLQVQQQMEA